MPRPRRYTQADLAELQHRHLAGMTLKEIARDLRRHPNSVSDLFRRYGLRKIYHGRRPFIFTAELMRRAQALYEQGLSIREVALALHVNPGSLATAWRIHGLPARTHSEAQRLRQRRAA